MTKIKLNASCLLLILIPLTHLLSWRETALLWFAGYAREAWLAWAAGRPTLARRAPSEARL
jgi:hypothetical protein